MRAEVFIVKTLLNVNENEKIFACAEKEFETRQSERKTRMDAVKEEMDKWRQPQKVKVVLSRKYR